MINLLVVLQVKVLQLSPCIECYLLIDLCDLLLQMHPSFEGRLRIHHIYIFIIVLLRLTTL